MRDPGSGTTKRKHTIRPASLPELAKLTGAMPEPYQALILLASWCALRFGELTELRRGDVVLDPDAGKGVIRIERAVVRVGDGFEVTTPKSDAGTRDVAIPPHLVGVIAEHLAKHVGPGAGFAAVPGPPRWAPGAGNALPAVLQGPRRGQPARSAVPRPAALRRRAGGVRGRHAGRADGPPRSLHAGRRPCATSTPRRGVTRPSRRTCH